MKRGVLNLWFRRCAPSWAVGIALLFAWAYGTPARADITGPVVGFQRVEVSRGPQWVAPSVHPFAPQADEGETTGQVLSGYLGEEFRSGASANDADSVGCAEELNGTGEVSMMWRDQHEQWRDPAGNDAEPNTNCMAGFWLELAFDGNGTAGSQTRELVLSGQVTW